MGWGESTTLSSGLCPFSILLSIWAMPTWPQSPAHRLTGRRVNRDPKSEPGEVGLGGLGVRPQGTLMWTWSPSGHSKASLHWPPWALLETDGE